MGDNKNISDQASDKLLCEIENAKKFFPEKGTTETLMKRSMVDPLGQMMIRFCYQDEEFATAVLRSDRELHQVVNEVMKNVTRDHPSLSDAEAYVLAVKCYLPAAEVNVSIRVILPEERDSDLLLIGTGIETDTNESRAMILDLFDTGEV